MVALIIQLISFYQRIGKSRLVRSLLDEEEFADDQDTFIVDFFRKKINFDNLRIKLEIW